MADNDTCIGKIIGNYRVEKVIGEGSMGTVYLGSQPQTNNKAAIKILHPAYAIGPSGKRHLKRFQKEAYYTSLLNHPNIVKIYESGEQDGLFYITMEFVPGQSLLDIIQAEGPVDQHRVLKIAYQVTLALKAAHAKSVVHRDVKPGNILVLDNDNIKLADFGLARTIEGLSSVSQTGQIIGTVFYMSPEQAMGGSQIDHRIDFYGLGISLFHALTGKLPYVGRTPIQILQQHISSPIPSVRNYVPTIHPAIEELVKRLMAKRPDQRFFQAGDLLQQLEECETALQKNQTAARPKDSDALSPSHHDNLTKVRSWLSSHPNLARQTAVACALLLLFSAILMLVWPRLTPIAPMVAASNNNLPADSGKQPLLSSPSASPLVRLEISPREIWLQPHATIRFVVRGYDRDEQEFGLAVKWSASGGSIHEGLYTAGPTKSDYWIVVSDPQSGLEAKAIVHVGNSSETPAISLEQGWFAEKMPAGLQRASQVGDYLWKKDLSLMVFVPEGEFWMGDAKGKNDERPLRKIHLGAFYLDKYELSHQQYRQFCKATGYSLPPSTEWETTNQHPVVNVSWEDANHYARWAMKRLPTEAEWEKAAKGGFKIPDWQQDLATLTLNPYPRRAYPWGENLPHDGAKFLCNYVAYDHWQQRGEDGYIYTAPIGSFPAGISPYRCMDMAGNVWEWCEDTYQADFYTTSELYNPANRDVVATPNRVLRGGSWFNFAESCRTSRRHSAPYNSHLPWVGIRLAR